jgi:small-conductance mechanosensitive channel
MKKNYVLIAIALFCLSIVLVILGAIFKIMHFDHANFLLIIGMAVAGILSLTAFVLVLLDIAKSTIANKVVWILCLFISPLVTAILYFVNKENLIGKTD